MLWIRMRIGLNLMRRASISPSGSVLSGYVFSEEEVFSLAGLVAGLLGFCRIRLTIIRGLGWMACSLIGLAVPGVGGSSIVGSFDGCDSIYGGYGAVIFGAGCEFQFTKTIYVYPELQARFFMLRVCVQGQVNSVSMLHGLDEIFVDNARAYGRGNFGC